MKNSCSSSSCSRPVSCANQFLMQKIVGCGKVRQRCRNYDLCFEIPCQAQEPVSVVRAELNGCPSWEEKSCHERDVLFLCVTLPLCLTLRDRCGNLFSVFAKLTEEVKIRLNCEESDRWRGQIIVQAGVRLCGQSCGCSQNSQVPLEVTIDAYLVVFCPVGNAPPPCPPPMPWYPEPSYDPYRQT